MVKNNIGPKNGTKEIITQVNLSTGDSNSDFKIITTVTSHNKGMETGMIKLKILDRVMVSA